MTTLPETPGKRYVRPTEPAGDVTRDYAAETAALLDAETADASYSSPAVAHRIVEKLRATDPDLLAGWLDAQAVTLIRKAIDSRDSSARARARREAPRAGFAAAAGAFEAGDPTALDAWRKKRADEAADKLLAARRRSAPAPPPDSDGTHP